MSDLSEARERVRDRAATLPEPVWDCEACGSKDSMKIRRSSLNLNFYADDMGLKCVNGDDPCYNFRVHGIPFQNPDEFDYELEVLRNGDRVLDFAQDGEEPDMADNLAALGYIGAAEEVK